MQAAAIFTGLACGTLLAAVGLALWGSFRKMPGLSRAVRVIGWLAGILLLIGAWLAWQGNRSVSTPAPRLMLMAALAALPAPHRRSCPLWGSAMSVLPVLVVAGAGLFWASRFVGAGASGSPVAPTTLAIIRLLAVIICGGLGTRALGDALSQIVTSTPHIEWASAAAYALLTLVVGGTALANLWQRGSVWGETASESGLAGAWLVWSAAWLGPRQHPRPRAGAIILAALLLIVVAAGYSVLDI